MHSLQASQIAGETDKSTLSLLPEAIPGMGLDIKFPEALLLSETELQSYSHDRLTPAAAVIMPAAMLDKPDNAHPCLFNLVIV
jgi:hypothetical protein